MSMLRFPVMVSTQGLVMEQARLALMVAAALTATAFNANAQDGDVAVGRTFALEACDSCHIVEPTNAIASDRRHRPELSRHCKHQGYDGDGSAGFPYDFTPKYAKPDPHARSDSGCDRLYTELTRRPLTRQRGYLPFEEAPRGHVTDDAVGFGIRGSLDNGHECTVAERHAARQYLSSA